MIESEKISRMVVSALEELKAAHVLVLDVRGLTTITDFMVLASGSSNRQVRALADNVVRRAKEQKHPALGVEGEREGEWILVDLCDVVVHVMLPEVRDFYQLEKLWGDGELMRPASAERI